MQLRELSVTGAWEITPRQIADDRGVFHEAFTDPAFRRMAGHRFDLAQAQGVLYRDLNTVFVEAFEEFARHGWLPAHTPQAAATEIHALLDGLSVHLLLRQITPQGARATLEAALSRMLVNPASA